MITPSLNVSIPFILLESQWLFYAFMKLQTLLYTFFENGLEAELDEELGYSKYDHRNKDTDKGRTEQFKRPVRR